MKIIFTIAIVLLVPFMVHSQINAVTDLGDEVILNKDGSWHYVDTAIKKPKVEVYENPNHFTKKPNQKKLVKSNKINVGIYINPQTWKYRNGYEQFKKDYIFTNTVLPISAMIITEKVEIPLHSIKKFALENIEQNNKKIKLISEEIRIVNGVKLLYMKFEGTLEDETVIYVGYFYSGNEGTVQIISFTYKEDYEKLAEEMESFNNGFVTLK